MKVLVAPSILAADFSNLAKDIKKIEDAGADLLHIDVMDGHFVPNITIGPQQVGAIKKLTHLPLDVHLMIENPFKFLDAFSLAGANIITVHIEVIDIKALEEKRNELKKKNIRLGLALNPRTDIKRLGSAIDFLDFILLMSVDPGFCGQKFMPVVYSKVKALRKIFKYDIEVDGGVNSENSPRLISSGANILAAGSFVFRAKDVAYSIRSLRNEK